MTSTTGRMLRHLSLPLLLGSLAATPAAAQPNAKPAAQDPNAVDTGNFSATPASPTSSPEASSEASSEAQQALAHQIAQLPWQDGPASLAIGAATINLPAGYEILPPPEGEQFLQLNGNPPSPDDAADNILQSDDPASNWFAILTYEDAGHIADTQPINADALLATMQKLNDEDNAARQQKGQLTEALHGWAIPPTYDKTAHRLAWAFDFTNPDNSANVSLQMRLLGRTGDLKIVIVDDPASLAKDLPDIDKALAGGGFPAGQTYQDATASDPQAPYGLAAIIGGATPTPQPPPSPAAKSDWGYLLKAGIAIIVIGIVLGLLARLRKS
jgi:uncharacterized membrane-anchored protein